MVDIPVPVSVAAELPRAEVGDAILAKGLRCDDSGSSRDPSAHFERAISSGQMQLASAEKLDADAQADE